MENREFNQEVKNIVTDELLKEAKDDGYSSNNKLDFVSNGQIMVTITLGEYRQLVKAKAEHEANEARSKTYALEKERDSLKKVIEDLQKQLNDLKSMIANAATIKANVLDKAEAND